LLVDYDVDFVTDVKDRLEDEEFHAIIALTIQKGIELYYTMKPAFVLVNLEVNGLDHEPVKEFIKLIYQNFVPIALVSDTISLEKRIFAYEIGATDIIDKQVIHPDWFIPYLRNRLAQQQRVL